MKLRAKEQIKTLIAQEGILLKDLVQMLSDKTGKKYTSDSLSHKLGRGTISYDEVLLIADILGYHITFEK